MEKEVGHKTERLYIADTACIENPNSCGSVVNKNLLVSTRETKGKKRTPVSPPSIGKQNIKLSTHHFSIENEGGSQKGRLEQAAYACILRRLLGPKTCFDRHFHRSRCVSGYLQESNKQNNTATLRRALPANGVRCKRGCHYDL